MFEATTSKNELQNLIVTITLAGFVALSVSEAPITRQTDLPIYEHSDTKGEKLDEDLVWFYSDEWQAMEDAADEDYKAGRMKSYDSVDDLLASL